MYCCKRIMGSLDFHDEKIIIKLLLEFTITSPVINPHCQSIWNQKNLEIYSHIGEIRNWWEQVWSQYLQGFVWFQWMRWDEMGRKIGGGGGSRTRVLTSFRRGVYKHSWQVFSFPGRVGRQPPQSGAPPEVSRSLRRITTASPNWMTLAATSRANSPTSAAHGLRSKRCASGSIICVVGR